MAIYTCDLYWASGLGGTAACPLTGSDRYRRPFVHAVQIGIGVSLTRAQQIVSGPDYVRGTVRATRRAAAPVGSVVDGTTTEVSVGAIRIFTVDGRFE